MQTLLQTMALVFAVEGIQAVRATLKKEKIMIEEGGEPLPTSSYVFLVIRYLLQAVLALGLSYWLPELPVNKWVLLVVLAFLIILISRLIEVGIRTLIVMIKVRAYKKQVENKVVKKETK